MVGCEMILTQSGVQYVHKLSLDQLYIICDITHSYCSMVPSCVNVQWHLKSSKLKDVYEELRPESDSALPARALEALHGAMEQGTE